MGWIAGAGHADRDRGELGTHRDLARHHEGNALMSVGINVENLNAYFGKHQALHEINIQVQPSEATAIIGPSGCGKSTFVRCLNRMHETIPEARAEGTVKVGDADIYKMQPVAVRRKIGMG